MRVSGCIVAFHEIGDFCPRFDEHRIGALGPLVLLRVSAERQLPAGATSATTCPTTLSIDVRALDSSVQKACLCHPTFGLRTKLRNERKAIGRSGLSSEPP